MKIAYISTIKSTSWGGSEELWYQSAMEAIGRGNKLAVFVYDWNDEPDQIKQLRKKGAFIYKRRRVTSFVRRCLIRVTIKVNKHKPLYFNSYHPLLTFNPDLVIVTDGVTYYTADDEDLSGLLLNYFRDKYIIISQANTEYHLPSSRKRAIELFENAQNVFFVSEHNRQLAFHQLACRLTKTAIIQNPVLLDSFESIAFPPFDGIIHCAVIGRFNISDKGQDILVAMLNTLQWKKMKIKLHLFGKGVDKEYLQRLISFYDVNDKIVIEGFNEDRESIWRKCHCLLMCSHKEGTSLAMLEAMVAGRVCIVSNVGGAAEWIRDGYNGFLVDAPTKDLFSNKFETALERLAEWEFIGKNAHTTALEKMDYNPGKTLLERIGA